MTTRYDRMRAAATTLREFDVRPELADRLDADADELEAVEREMRAILIVDKWADRIRGEK